MLITTGGVLIRTRVSEIREMSRATQGVTLINLGADEKLAGLEKIVDSEDAGEGPIGDDGRFRRCGRGREWRACLSRARRLRRQRRPDADTGASGIISRKRSGKVGRVFNFSAGPAVLPEQVLEKARDEMLDWHGSGMSVMEMSHRGKEFIAIHAQAEANLRELLAIPANYKVLFLQGGAIAENAIVPMNLLRGRAPPTTSTPANGRRRRSRKRRSTAA